MFTINYFYFYIINLKIVDYQYSQFSTLIYQTLLQNMKSSYYLKNIFLELNFYTMTILSANDWNGKYHSSVLGVNKKK